MIDRAFSGAYSGPCQTSKTDLLAEIITGQAKKSFSEKELGGRPGTRHQIQAKEAIVLPPFLSIS